MYYIFDVVTVFPGELHELTCNQALRCRIHNCGPGPVLVDDHVVLHKGDITVVSGTGPTALMCDQESYAVVILQRALS
jgi:hypothetical protein